MEARGNEHRRGSRPQRNKGRRLVLISSDGDGALAAAPPVRILGSEPRLRGSFRLTDR